MVLIRFAFGDSRSATRVSRVRVRVSIHREFLVGDLNLRSRAKFQFSSLGRRFPVDQSFAFERLHDERARVVELKLQLLVLKLQVTLILRHERVHVDRNRQARLRRRLEQRGCSRALGEAPLQTLRRARDHLPEADPLYLALEGAIADLYRR